jgi:hypothetical protein
MSRQCQCFQRTLLSCPETHLYSRIDLFPYMHLRTRKLRIPQLYMRHLRKAYSDRPGHNVLQRFRRVRDPASSRYNQQTPLRTCTLPTFTTSTFNALAPGCECFVAKVRCDRIRPLCSLQYYASPYGVRVLPGMATKALHSVRTANHVWHRDRRGTREPLEGSAYDVSH